MKKYWTLFSVSLQDAFSERGAALIWAFLDFLGPLMSLFVWLAIFQTQGDKVAIGGFTLSQMLTYYFGVALISAVATAHNEWDVARQIQSGELSLYLTRPFSYLRYHFITNIAWKILKGLSITPFLLLAFFFLQEHLSFRLTLGQGAAFGLVLSLAYLLYFLNSMVFGLIPFWLEEYGSLVELNEMVRALFSGMAIPVAFLPGFFLTLGQLLPYRYLYDFPLRILAGKIPTGEIFVGITVQVFWILLFFFLYQWLWRKGVRRYAAYGG